MNENGNTTSTTTGTPTLTDGKYNVNVTGFVNSDTDSVFNTTNVQNLLNGVEDKTSEVNDKQLSDHTNAGTYNIKDNATLTDSNITVTGQDTTSKHYNLLADKNYNYTLSDGAHTEVIKPITVTVTIAGSRTYGDANGTSTISTPTASGWKDWDNGKFTDAIATDLKNNVQNQTAVADHDQ